MHLRFVKLETLLNDAFKPMFALPTTDNVWSLRNGKHAVSFQIIVYVISKLAIASHLKAFRRDQNVWAMLRCLANCDYPHGLLSTQL